MIRKSNCLITIIQKTTVKFCAVLIKLKYPILLASPFLASIRFRTNQEHLEPTFQAPSFFLPPTVDRIEKINKYLGSVNHNVVDIDKNELGENFNPSVLYSMGDERNAARKSVLNVLTKVADHSSQILKRNAGGYSASVPHNNDTLLWPGGKRTQSHKFVLSY